MISFPRKVWRLLVAIKDGLALLFLILFFFFLFGIMNGKPNPAVAVSKGALVVELDGIVTEQPAEVDPLALLSGGGGQVQEHRLRDVIHGIRTAAKDDRVSAVVVDLSRFMGAGQVAIGEIGDALDTVRAAKKPVFAYAAGYGDDAYQIAAHSSEIWIEPIGGAVVTGPGGSRLYYKDLLDRLGVTANVYRVGTFKSAVEPYLRTDQSPEAAEADRAYASALWNEWLADVKKARPKAQLDAYVADPMTMIKAANNDMAKAALNAGLIDKIGDNLAFGRRVAEISGTPDDNRPWDYNAIPLGTWVAANPAPTDGDPIAIIPVVGTIVDGEAGNGTAGGETIEAHILDALANEDVKALVLRVDSPGGSVFASEKIRKALLQAKARKLPVVVSMANVAASGGYWVSTPADKIFAEPDTITGSIGVFAVLPSFENSLAKIGVNADGIKTTPLSGEPDLFGGPSNEFDALAQAGVEDVYARFSGLVAKNRRLTPEQVEALAEGRVWAGGTARQLGLVDAYGGLDDAIAEAAKLAKLDAKNVYPLWFENEPSPFAKFLSGIGGQPEGRAAPQGWMGLVAARRDAMLALLVQDMAMLATGPSMQIQCLECRGFMARPMAGGSAQDADAMAALARLFVRD
ncbi:MAG: signal peptide peptidase SppA [Pseudomonadota bacterium]